MTAFSISLITPSFSSSSLLLMTTITSLCLISMIPPGASVRFGSIWVKCLTTGKTGYSNTTSIQEDTDSWSRHYSLLSTRWVTVTHSELARNTFTPFGKPDEISYRMYVAFEDGTEMKISRGVTSCSSDTYSGVVWDRQRHHGLQWRMRFTSNSGGDIFESILKGITVVPALMDEVIISEDNRRATGRDRMGEWYPEVYKGKAMNDANLGDMKISQHDDVKVRQVRLVKVPFLKNGTRLLGEVLSHTILLPWKFARMKDITHVAVVVTFDMGYGKWRRKTYEFENNGLTSRWGHYENESIVLNGSNWPSFGLSLRGEEFSHAMTMADVESIYQSYRNNGDWTSTEYQLIAHNCGDFAESFFKSLELSSRRRRIRAHPRNDGQQQQQQRTIVGFQQLFAPFFSIGKWLISGPGLVSSAAMSRSHFDSWKIDRIRRLSIGESCEGERIWIGKSIFQMFVKRMRHHNRNRHRDNTGKSYGVFLKRVRGPVYERMKANLIVSTSNTEITRHALTERVWPGDGMGWGGVNVMFNINDLKPSIDGYVHFQTQLDLIAPHKHDNDVNGVFKWTISMRQNGDESTKAQEFHSFSKRVFGLFDEISYFVKLKQSVDNNWGLFLGQNEGRRDETLKYWFVLTKGSGVEILRSNVIECNMTSLDVNLAWGFPDLIPADTIESHSFGDSMIVYVMITRS